MPSHSPDQPAKTAGLLPRFSARMVDFCLRRRGVLLLFFAVVTILAGWAASSRLSLDSNTEKLISQDLPWRQKQQQLDWEFPQRVGLLAIVIDAPAAAQAEDAVTRLAARLRERPDLFETVRIPGGGEFFKKNGLLFLPEDQLKQLSAQLAKAQPMIGSLASDPSLRGLASALDLLAEGIVRKAITPEKVDPYLARFRDVAEFYADGQENQARATPSQAMRLDWNQMLTGRPVDSVTLRRFILAQPRLDFSQLAAGKGGSDFIRAAAQELRLRDSGITVRITGEVALADEELSSVADGTILSGVLSVTLVGLLLYRGLRRWRLIAPLLITLVMGLIWTGGFAAVTVGTLNPISVAFATMFIGIAIDFGIQFGTRYRVERHHTLSQDQALRDTAYRIAGPLILAALATSVGFLAFLPTSYVGVSQLGLIAGGGMIIAVFLNLTLLPVLISLFKPGAEHAVIGYPHLRKLDHAMTRHHPRWLIAWGILILLACFAATRLQFDFNALHLKDAQTESVSTLYDLMQDPGMSPFTAEILARDQAEANKIAAKIKTLPDIYRVLTLSSFVPDDQDRKLAILSDMALWLEPSLVPAEILPPPSDAENQAALRMTAEQLRAVAADSPTAGKLAIALDKIADAPEATRQGFAEATIAGIVPQLAQLRLALTAEPVSLANLPDDLRRDWQASDGRVRVEAFPAGDTRDNRVLIDFADRILALVPDAAGSAISIQKSGAAVSEAFLQAGSGALLAIAVLLGVVLRRVKDAILVIIPIILALILTGGTMVLIGLPLNFANIIALPLMLGIGVAFSIYYVMQWRNGDHMLLSAPLTRAVIFSALTTLSAFGSLAISSHPGTASMGILLTLSLAWVLATTLFLLPALLAAFRTHGNKQA